jgi:predicted methyltransferase
MKLPIVLSYFQVEAILRTKAEGKTSAQTSTDLGITSEEVMISPEGVLFANGERLGWGQIKEIGEANRKCFTVENNSIREIQIFSEDTDWVRSLAPTKGAPTMLVSGIPMHRIKETDPITDTLTKIKAIEPIVGRVLDTATGLGYTAIEAAKTADEVVTVELDPADLEIARFNPWSQALFDNPKIIQIVGDSFEVIKSMEDSFFTRIIHDPPTFSLAGELYSQEFYCQLLRVLRKGGRLFHYIGDPESQLGKRTTPGVIRRLQEAGFVRVVRHPEAFGVVAFK